MRMRKKPWAEAEISVGKHIVHNAENCAGKWSSVFGNDNPIRVEIGMGKGKFIIGKALGDPRSNYIGIEKHLSVFASASSNIHEHEEHEANGDIVNIRIIHANAEAFSNMFEENEVDEIYINFCDPWQKKRFEKRRLTHSGYLSKYAKALKNEGRLIFKSDSTALFEFTQNMLKESGWHIQAISTDLHNDSTVLEAYGNIMTEYEERFFSVGKPIYRIAAINGSRI